MKKAFQTTKVKAWASILILVLFMINISCEKEKFFDGIGPVVATHFDGIQNLDETGIDCGGSSGVNCPTCTDGIRNGDEIGIDCGGSNCPACPIGTPRADAFASSSLPYYFTFEADDAGLLLTTFSENQGVDISYGVDNPNGTANDFVAKVIRPDDGRFGGFEDYKFSALDTPIDFSVYYKWTMEVFIPTGQNFSGALNPEVVLILMDSNNNFWERWTEIPIIIDEADFGSWVTLEFDGTDVVGANGIVMQEQTTYNTIALRFGGAGHTESGIFYIKDLVPTTRNFGGPSTTPRADALINSGLPYFFTFEANDAGLALEPFTVNADGSPYNQGVDITYGVDNPDGTVNDLVAQIIRPNDFRFGGFEDYKFQTLNDIIDFSTFHKFKLDVYIPSSNDFSGALEPRVVLNLHDYNTNFFERWTQISITVDESDFDKWITVEFDGTNAAASGSGVLLPAQTTYTNISLQFGGAGHGESGTFYVKDFVPYQ